MARRGMGGARRQLGRVVRKARAVYRGTAAPGQAATATSALAELAQRNTAFFDVEWYEVQTGRTFASLEKALSHADRSVDARALSPHPLFLPPWGRTASSRKREKNSERYVSLFDQGWPPRSPHPLVDLEHLAEHHPESVEDPDGVFGWLLKQLDSGAPLAALPGVDAVDWAEARQAQLDAVRAMREESDRVRRWQAGREAESYDWQADAEHVRRLTARTVEAPADRPLVTVVMPAYNRAGQIGTAIESVQAQTLTSWELVIADDGSSDDTVAVARRYAATDERITVIELEHQGVSAARNAAIEAGRGTWFAFLDTDNTWVPHFLAAMVSALSDAQAVHGYSALQVEDDTGEMTYRVLDGADTLDIGNHIDLNIWVVDGEHLRRAGMFDVTLRRAVDYDLIWRVARTQQPLYVPFVGSYYSARTDGAERITDVEAFTWKEVVRNKHLVDWEALSRQERQAGVSAVVVCNNDSAEDLSATVRSLWQAADVAEVVVVGASNNRQTAPAVRAEATLSAKVKEVRTPSMSPSSLLANIGFSRTTRTDVLFVRPGTVLPAGSAATLAAAVADGSVVSQPVLHNHREIVVQAGLQFLDHPDAAVPSRVLEGHPLQDVSRLPETVRSHAASFHAMLTPAETFLSLGGFDPLLGNYWFDAEYCLRAFDATRRPVTTCTRVVGRAVDRKDLGWGQAVRSAVSVLAAKRELVLDSPPEPWDHTPFEVVDTRFEGPEGENSFLRPPRPVVRLRPELGFDEGQRLRVAVKHCAPAGEAGEKWGDLYFARHLADALAREGHDVVVDNRDSCIRPSATLDLVNIVIRGVRPIHPVPGAVNLLWIISRPDTVRPEELVGFDHVYAASSTWAARASARFGREIRPLPQATDVHTFFPRPRDAVQAPAALFVGNRRAEYRRPVAAGMLLAADEIDVGIYGGGWHRDGVTPPVLRGEFIENADLPLYYSAADLVLNDHFPTMRDHGFLNNRVLDALACGTPVLSDRVPGAEELLGDRVLWYSEADEIPDRMREYLAAPWPESRRAEVAEWVAANHSFDARARVLLADVAATARERSARSAS